MSASGPIAAIKRHNEVLRGNIPQVLTFYIASSLKNKELNLRIERVLVKLGHRCFLPQRDAMQPDDCSDSKRSKRTSEQNIYGITTADAIVVVARNAGNDTSWEAGFGRAIGKCVVIVNSREDRAESHPMLWHGAHACVRTKAYTDVEEVMKKVVELLLGVRKRMS